MLYLAMDLAAVALELAAIGGQLALAAGQFAGLTLLLLVGSDDPANVAAVQGCTFAGARGGCLRTFLCNAGLIGSHGFPITRNFIEVAADITIAAPAIQMIRIGCRRQQHGSSQAGAEEQGRGFDDHVRSPLRRALQSASCGAMASGVHVCRMPTSSLCQDRSVTTLNATGITDLAAVHYRAIGRA